MMSFILSRDPFGNTVSDSECFVSSSQGYKDMTHKGTRYTGEHKGELPSGSYIIYLSIPYASAQQENSEELQHGQRKP